MTPDCGLCDLCPQLTINELFPTVTQNHKTAHTVSPNGLDQISLPRASMPPMTSFYNSQFHCSITVKVGQILTHTFLSQKSGHGH